MKRLHLKVQFAIVGCLCLCHSATVLQAQLYYTPNIGNVYYYGGKINLVSAYQYVLCNPGKESSCINGNSSDSFYISNIGSSSFDLTINSSLPYNTVTQKRITINLYSGGLFLDKYSYGVCYYSNPEARFHINQLHPGQIYSITYEIELYYASANSPKVSCSHYYFSSHGNITVATRSIYGRIADTGADDQHVTVQIREEDNLNEENLPNIYPNPVVDLVNIDVPDGETIEYWQVISLTEQNILKQGNMSPIDIGDLSPGLYIVRIKTNTQIYIRRISKL